MNLTRVVAPAGPVVPLDDLKAYLRVDHDHEDILITALEQAAVAKLDGFRGILGRCILPQTWAVTFDKDGTYHLPLADVTAVTAEDAEGSPVDAVLSYDDLGAKVTLPGAATVEITAQLPDDLLDVVKQAIKLLVGHWYENREAVAEEDMTQVPLAFTALAGVARRVMV